MVQTKNELAKQIGRKLTQAREEAGLSRAEVGKRLGLTERGYGHIEAGRSLIGLDYLLQLPIIFGKPITHFLPASVVSDEEMADALLDPRLRYIVSNWPSLTEELQDLLARYVRLWLTTKRGRSDADQPEHE